MNGQYPVGLNCVAPVGNKSMNTCWKKDLETAPIYSTFFPFKGTLLQI